MRKLIMGLGVASVLLFTGCAQHSSPSPGKTYSVVQNGKHYYIPLNTSWYQEKFSPSFLRAMQTAGMNCNSTDLLWIRQGTPNIFKNVKSEKEGIKKLRAAYKKNQLGCVHPVRKNTTQNNKTYSNNSYSQASYSNNNYNSNSGGTYNVSKNQANSVRQYGGTNNYRVNGKTHNVRQYGGTNNYRVDGKTYNVRQYGGTNIYNVKEARSKGPQWNNVGVQY